MSKQSIAPPPPALLARVVDLQTTAEFITALAQVVENQIDAVRAHMRDPAFSTVSLAEIGDWDEMYTILSLLRSQSAIVRETSLAMEDAHPRNAA